MLSGGYDQEFLRSRHGIFDVPEMPLFLFVDDFARAVVFLMERRIPADVGQLINVGTGEELSIRALAEKVRDVVYEDCPGRTCTIEWDRSKPNGSPRKLLDCSKLAALGWRSTTTLSAGLKAAYGDFLGR